ncbi:MAG: hypothetical protein M0Z95_23830 [Actinomycetota bacterium]|jgi:hypothetical protein|nr:hypothetical protein [Actinomycetota bacterium]
MTDAATPPLDDLAVDYSIGQVMEALSILEIRGELPKWALPHVSAVESVLSPSGVYPPYVGQCATRVCQQHGFVLDAIVGGLHELVLDGTTGSGCPIRTVRTFLSGWRKEMRASRPTPKFTPRPR